MRFRFQQFMYGRYGHDPLNRVLNFVALIFCILSLLTGWQFFYFSGLTLLFFTLFRAFSRNIAQRQREYQAFSALWGRMRKTFFRIKNRFSQRRTHRFFACPTCKQQLRVPKGRGKIAIHCPKCHTSFERKT